MEKITYTVEKNNDHYVLWLNKQTDGGFGFRSITTGTKKECEKRKKEILNETTRKRRIRKKVNGAKNI